MVFVRFVPAKRPVRTVRNISSAGLGASLSEARTPPYLKGLAVALVALLVLTTGAGLYYYSSSAALQAKDQEILRLRTVIISQNLTVLNMQLEMLNLEQNISSLHQQIVALLQDRAASNVQIASLTGQVSSLENRSALLGLELAVVENATGHVSVLTYFVNRTLTVPPSSTVQVTSQTPGRAGTLVLLSPDGCRSAGNSVKSSTPTFEYYILLDPGSSNLLRSNYVSVNSTAFTFSLQNVGTTQATCTLSLLYVGR